MKLDVDNKARVAFAVVAVVIVIVAAAWISIWSTRYKTYQIRTHDPVSGLIADAPIEYHGVDVGRVTRVELIDSHSIRVLLSVERAAPVSAATVATITTRGLAARGFTGYVYVSLEDAGTDSSSLTARSGEEYPVIPMTRPKSVSLDTTISRMDENLQRVSDRINEVLDDKTVASLKQSVDNLERVTTVLADNNAKLNTLITTGERASRELGSLLASSNDTLSALQTQVLPQAHKTLADLDDLSTSLTGFAKQVNKDPSVVVRGVAQRPLGPGEKR